jgi:hypothetical protein
MKCTLQNKNNIRPKEKRKELKFKDKNEKKK